MGMLQKSEEKSMKKRERVPLSSLSSPKSSPKLRKMNMTLASSPSVSNDTIHKILNEHFVISKKSARWVTKFLSHISAEIGDWFTAVALPVHWKPALFAGIVPGILLLVFPRKGGPGWAKADCWQPEIRLGWGHRHCRQGSEYRRGLWAVWVPSYVDPARGQSCWKTLHYKVLVPVKCLPHFLFYLACPGFDRTHLVQ